jgi:hypothetical protein
MLEDRCVPSAFAASAGALNLSGQQVGSGQGVGTDAAGNVYTVGYVGGTTSPSDADGFVAKYSADGLLQWKQVVQDLYQGATSLFDSADTIAVDPAGNSYVAGTFRETLTLGNFTITSTGPLDVFVEKLDTNGNVLWLHQFANTGNFGPPNFDRLGTCAPKSIAVDHAGNVVIAGAFTGHIDMDPANPGQHFLDYPAPGQSGHPDGYVVKLNGTNGNFVWEAQVVNVQQDGVGAEALTVDAHNNVYSLGGWANNTYFNDHTANNSVQQNANSLTLNGPNITNLYVWKLNADGTNAWVSQVTSQTYNAPLWGLGIAVNAQGDIYTTGAFNGASVDFDPTISHAGNPDIVTSPTFNYNTFVDKMDSGGHFLWVRQVSSSADNWGRALTLDSTGDPYITGFVTGDSLLGNILLTPASSANNSYIAELSPAGNWLCAQKSIDLSPNGDQAEAIAVDSLGYVDIVGTFTSQMQWPGLPLLDAAGGSDIFTVKTMLKCTTIKSTLQGTVLHLAATDQANHLIEITDDRYWGILVQLDQDSLRAYQGLTQIDLTSGGGDYQVTAAFGRSAVRPPDLNFHLVGNGGHTLNMTGDFSGGSPFTTTPWNLNFVTGNGVNTLLTNIIGSVPVNMTTNLGDGVNSDIYELHDTTEMPVPTTLVFNGGSGVNDIRVMQDFSLPSVDPGLQPASTVIIHGGSATNQIQVDYAFHPTERYPANFHTPLVTRITGSGNTTAQVGYHFMNAVGAYNGTFNVFAPITLDVSGTGIRKVHVDFDDDVPPPDTAMPTLQMFSALNFHLAGGLSGATLQMNVGVPNPTGDPSIVDPVLMSGGSLAVTMSGTGGSDTIGAGIWLDPTSMGQVTARVLGGGGNDNLTLDLACPADDIVAALINGGAGLNIAHHTLNVRVTNCDEVFLD